MGEDSELSPELASGHPGPMGARNSQIRVCLVIRGKSREERKQGSEASL